MDNSKTEYDEESEDEWINAMDNAYESIVRKRFEYLKVIEDDQRKSEQRERDIQKEEDQKRMKQHDEKMIEQAARSRKLEEVAFVQEVENIKELIKSEENKDSPAVNALETSKEDLKRQLEHCKRAHGQYVLLLETEKANEEMSWIVKFQDICARLSQRIGELIQQQKDQRSKKDGGMKLERMKLPTFDGNLREYPRFKSDFERHIVPELDSNEKATYVLKSCLTGPPLQDVRNVDCSLSEMWKRLDEKYGQPSKLADIVVLEIKELKPVKEEEDEAFLKLVNTVERGYYDLARIKM